MNKALIVILSLAFAACVPQPFTEDSELRLVPPPKESSSVDTPLDHENAFLRQEEARLAPLPSVSDDSRYFVKLLSVQELLTQDDVKQIRPLLQETSILNRAILVLAGLRFYLHAGLDPMLFQQAELTERTVSDGADWGTFESLEGVAAAFEVSFADELASNPFLENPVVVDLALRALEKGNENLSYAMSIHKAIDTKRASWSTFQERLIAFQKWHEGALSAIQETGDTLSAPALPVFMEELKSGEDILKRGQEYIDQSKFQESIALLRTIDASNIHHSAAEEKIKEAANKAVAELRQKAARAFQSAIPVTDSKARNAYLRDARKFLLTALKLYPEADQIHTVKQNLNVINKNLELLNNGPSEGTSD
ncbi:MAG: hypothetical protein HYW48_03700 [Deltaproteobacteria bacterium]|nr:hypothetical protein [Deltaproteobacteria bacterium]